MKILIIVAHPDDEVIGMGGTISKHITMRDKVFVMSLTDGVSSRPDTTNSDILIRKNSSLKASKLIGYSWIGNNNFKDNCLDTYPLLDIVKIVEEVKYQIKPDLVYTHNSQDLNIDHKIVCHATITAFRPHFNENCKEIRFFEVPSSTDYGNEIVQGQFNPNLFINIDNFWSIKEKALNAYKQEMKKYPNSRSIKGIKNLSLYRGNQIGLNMAEAFQILRKIEN